MWDRSRASSSDAGRPVFATDDLGVKVWEASYLPFGGVHTSTGTNTDLRFPGQWFQSESGLHQNWMRDYDPTLGRYIQADPLGLVAGVSLYGYALQNPNTYIDPNGENPIIAAMVIGAAANMALGYAMDQTFGDGCYTWQEAGFDAAVGALFGVWGNAAKVAQASRASAAAITSTAERIATKAVQKKNNLKLNKLNGNAFRDEIASALQAAGRGVNKEVSVKTPFGRRVMDIEVSHNGLVVGYVETKIGNSRYTSSQRAKDFWIEVTTGLKTTVIRGK